MTLLPYDAPDTLAMMPIPGLGRENPVVNYNARHLEFE